MKQTVHMEVKTLTILLLLELFLKIAFGASDFKQLKLWTKRGGMVTHLVYLA
jgi:hypothetical protein